MLFIFILFREDIETLEEISPTDIKCVWSTQKVVTKERYKPVPIDEMPCFTDKVKRSNIETDDDGIRTFFCQNLPNSAISKHRFVLSFLITKIVDL